MSLLRHFGSLEPKCHMDIKVRDVFLQNDMHTPNLPRALYANSFFLKKLKQRQPCLSTTEIHTHTAAGSPRKDLAIEKMQGLGSFLIQHGKADQSHLWMSTLKP